MRMHLGMWTSAVAMAALVVTGTVSAADMAGDAESLTSLKQNGKVKIGGEVILDVVYAHRDDGDANGDGVRTDNEENDDIDSTSFTTDDAYLEVDVDMAPDATLNILLDLDDLSDSTLNDDDLLEECFFQWSNKFGGAWSFSLGKKTVDYGSCDAPGITGTMQEDGYCEWLSNREKAGGGSANAHATVGTNSFGAAATQPTDMFVIDAEYTYKDLVRVYGAVFQSGSGMHEDRSDDHMGLQSFAFKLDVMPKENLTLSASLINYHNDSMSDGDERMLAGDATLSSAGDASANTTAMSIYADYTFSSVPLRAFAQYQHCWDAMYNEEVNTDIATLFFVYGVTEKIDLGLMGEYACIDNAPGYDDEDYWQVALNATYNTDYGLSYTIEYAYATYDGEQNNGGDDLDSDAHIIGFRTSYSF